MPKTRTRPYSNNPEAEVYRQEAEHYENLTKSRALAQSLIESGQYDPQELQDYVGRGGDMKKLVKPPKPLLSEDEQILQDAKMKRAQKTLNPVAKERRYTNPSTREIMIRQMDPETNAIQGEYPALHESGAVQFEPTRDRWKGKTKLGAPWSMDSGEYGEPTNYEEGKVPLLKTKDAAGNIVFNEQSEDADGNIIITPVDVRTPNGAPVNPNPSKKWNDPEGWLEADYETGADGKPSPGAKRASQKANNYWNAFNTEITRREKKINQLEGLIKKGVDASGNKLSPKAITGIRTEIGKFNDQKAKLLGERDRFSQKLEKEGGVDVLKSFKKPDVMETPFDEGVSVAVRNPQTGRVKMIPRDMLQDALTAGGELIQGE